MTKKEKLGLISKRKQLIGVMDVYGDNNKMTVTIKGISEWSNSEIREIIEEAFLNAPISEYYE